MLGAENPLTVGEDLLWEGDRVAGASRLDVGVAMPARAVSSLLRCATDESQVWTLVLLGERLLLGAGD